MTIRNVSTDYLVPWNKKNPGNRTDHRHKFTHEEALEAAQLSALSRGAKCVNRSLEEAFGMQVKPKVKREFRKVTYQGQTLTIRQWAKVKGLGYQCLRARILHGWPLDIAMETPVASIKRLGEKRIK